jgi:hypothetical protein
MVWDIWFLQVFRYLKQFKQIETEQGHMVCSYWHVPVRLDQGCGASDLNRVGRLRLAHNWRVSQHSKSKKFLRMRTRKPTSNLGDVINERDRWDLHTLEEIAQRKCSTERGWCSCTSLLLLAIRSDLTPQVATPPRDAHVQRTNDSAFPVQRDMVEW